MARKWQYIANELGTLLIKAWSTEEKYNPNLSDKLTRRMAINNMIQILENERTRLD